MILTHTGMFGDFGTSLVIPNYYYKKRGEKTTFILSEWFKDIVGLDEFLMRQEFTEKVIYDPFRSEFGPNGAQPYHFKPHALNDEKYYNLGIRLSHPQKYMGIVYAREYGLGYDLDIKLKFLDPDFPQELRGMKLYTRFPEKDRYDKHLYVDFFNNKLPEQGFVPFDPSKSLIHNLNLAYYASETYFYPNGFSIYANLCGIPINEPGSVHKMMNAATRSDAYYISQNVCIGVSGSPVFSCDPIDIHEYRNSLNYIHDISNIQDVADEEIYMKAHAVFRQLSHIGTEYFRKSFT